MYLLKSFLVLMLIIPTVFNATANIPVTGKKISYNDSILVKVSFTRVAGKTRLYSNNLRETLYFTALGEGRKQYQLFLFDMVGKLVSQTRICDSETVLLSGFEKGNYMFEIFNNDERIEYGSVIIK